MRFAITDNERSLPLPGVVGACPVCGSPVIAKCGSVRVHHWAHRGERDCDDWWEPETEWHRAWKMNFPSDWQEVIRYAASGERHIADVRTADGLTIEFQRSHLRPEERAARESFYGDMVWVVDGLRLRRDLPRFKESFSSLRLAKDPGVYLHHFPEEMFPENWLTCSAPVFFDFGCATSVDDPEATVEQHLWCLLPQRFGREAVVLKMPREQFIRVARERAKGWLDQILLLRVKEYLERRAPGAQPAKLSSENLMRELVRRNTARRRMRRF
jgi:competence protein CoiA